MSTETKIVGPAYIPILPDHTPIYGAAIDWGVLYPSDGDNGPFLLPPQLGGQNPLGGGGVPQNLGGIKRGEGFDAGGSGPGSNPGGGSGSVKIPCAKMNPYFNPYDKAQVAAAQASIPSGPPPDGMTPQIKQAILDAAMEWGINPRILFGIAMKETQMGKSSLYTPQGTGDHGHGRGLWQIDDYWGKKPPLSLSDDDLLRCQTDPAFCAMQAAKLLASDLQANNGDLTLAIEAYNGTVDTQTTYDYAYVVGNYIQQYCGCGDSIHQTPSGYAGSG